MGENTNGSTGHWHFIDQSLEHGHVPVAQIYYNTSVEDRTTTSWERRESMDTSSCLPLHVWIPFTLQELFPQMWVKETDKMIPQSIPLKHKVCHQEVKTSYMRFVTRGDMERQQAWSKPNPPWRKEDVWSLQKYHPLTYNSTDRGTMGLFHQNYCTNQHNNRNKFLAGFKVIFW